jgi:hypothetical protein
MLQNCFSLNTGLLADLEHLVVLCHSLFLSRCSESVGYAFHLCKSICSIFLLCCNFFFLRTVKVDLFLLSFFKTSVDCRYFNFCTLYFYFFSENRAIVFVSLSCLFVSLLRFLLDSSLQC